MAINGAGFGFLLCMGACTNGMVKNLTSSPGAGECCVRVVVLHCNMVAEVAINGA
jgi:hypothetical protein